MARLTTLVGEALAWVEPAGGVFDKFERVNVAHLFRARPALAATTGQR